MLVNRKQIVIVLSWRNRKARLPVLPGIPTRADNFTVSSSFEQEDVGLQGDLPGLEKLFVLNKRRCEHGYVRC
jgi:hypothetical protein